MFIQYQGGLGNSYGTIVYAAMAFSLLSIIISVLSLSSRRSIMRSTDYVSISFDVKGLPNARRHRNKVKNIKYDLSSLFGISSNLIEIQRPTQIPKGLAMVVNFRINNAKQIDMNIRKMVLDANQSGELADIIKSAWRLESRPLIMDLECNKHDSKIRKNNTVMISAMSESRNMPITSSPINGKQINATKIRHGMHGYVPSGTSIQMTPSGAQPIQMEMSPMMVMNNSFNNGSFNGSINGSLNGSYNNNNNLYLNNINNNSFDMPPMIPPVVITPFGPPTPGGPGSDEDYDNDDEYND